MGELSGMTTAELNRIVPRPRKVNGMLVPLLVGRRRIRKAKVDQRMVHKASVKIVWNDV